MSSKSKKKPRPKVGKRSKPRSGKKPPDAPPPLEVVKDEDPAPDQPSEPPPEPKVRPLNQVQALQYKFAMLQEELVGEKKKTIHLKRVVIRKDEEILALRRETASLKETVVNREEQDLFKTSAALLQHLGVGEDEEVLIDGGRLFVAPKGTAQKRKGSG